MKYKLFLLYGFLHTLKYPSLLKESIKSIYSKKMFDDKKHLRLACDWLLYMQNSDGGYARKFSFINKRDKSYIETTGYIIPSMIKAGEFLDEQRYVDSALKAGKWLLKVQNKDGSFSEIDSNKPYAFDTGQCLDGLLFLYDFTKDRTFLEASKRASYWLMEHQEDDGSWQKVAYNEQKHTYYSKVASAMYKYSLKENDEVIKEASLKHIRWVLQNQKQNGFFRYASFLENTPAYLHTMIYILEGLLDIYEDSFDKTILSAILKNSEKLKSKNLLCSFYDEDFNCKSKEFCMTGLAQWAVVCLRLYDITKDKEYMDKAKDTISFLKKKQLKNSFMKGGFSASVPFWGRYGAFDFVNWTNKYFIDAMLLYMKKERS